MSGQSPLSLSRIARHLGFALATGLAVFTSPAAAQSTLYWDTNGFWGFGSSNSGGTWDQGSSAYWSTSAWGWFVTPRTWNTVAGPKIAAFSAGTNATGSFTVSVAGNVTDVAGITFEEGDVTVAGGGTLNLTGAPTVTVDAASAAIAARLAGSTSLTKAGTGALTLSGNNTFTGGFTLADGTVNVAHANALGSGPVTLAGGTLSLQGISLSLASLAVTGNSTIDFAGASTLNLGAFSIADGVTLTVTNWSNASNFFFTQIWSGAALDTRGQAPVNQVVFNGFTGSDTKWQSYDKQVTPVPEPATYGALLLLGGAGLLRLARRRAAVTA